MHQEQEIGNGKNTEGARSETWKVAFWSPFMKNWSMRMLGAPPFTMYEDPWSRGPSTLAFQKKISALDSTEKLLDLTSYV